MTLDEALATLGHNGPPDGKWAEFRERQAEATRMLAQLRWPELSAGVPALAKLIEASHDSAVQTAAAAPLARAALELHDEAGFVERIARASFTKPYLDALVRLDASDVDVWPLVQAMLAAEQLRPQDTVRVLAPMFERVPSVARFEEVVAAAPAVALKLCWELRVWKQQPLGQRRPGVVRFALGAGDEALRIEALQLIAIDGELDEPSRVALQELLSNASVPLACALAALLVRQAMLQGVEPEALLHDVRADVRCAGFVEYVRDERLPRSALPAVISGWSDPDPRIREAAERALRRFCEQEPLGREALEAIVQQLHGRADVAAFLAWVAAAQPPVRDWCLEHLPAANPVHVALRAVLTRVCARCRDLSRGSTWHLDDHRPQALSRLEHVAVLESDDCRRLTLLRCPECQAHFTLLEWSIIDVNSRDDTWVLTRLRLAELRARHAKHVDFTHQRLLTYLDAARADLHHLDAKVRADADWELSG